MFRLKNFAAFFMFFTVLGSAAVFAQTPQTPQQQQQKVEVSDAELTKFARAFQEIRMINQEVQQEMMGVVQSEGMDIQRFNEIHQATVDPEVEVEATAAEKEQHKNITSELEEIQVKFQGRLEKVITDQGLTIQQYEKIAMGLQNDPELQERLRKEFQG